MSWWARQDTKRAEIALKYSYLALFNLFPTNKSTNNESQHETADPEPIYRYYVRIPSNLFCPLPADMPH
jgi:hypothetical protein